MAGNTERKDAASGGTLGDEGLIGLDDLYYFVPFHRAHIHKLVRRGEFPQPLKLGRRTVWWRRDIRDWLARQG